MKKFENVISLGYFCSPAMELERIGLRKISYPFDWLICGSFETVITLIRNNFEDFLDIEHFYQLKNYPSYYRNTLYNIDFYHDFSVYKSLESQFDSFSEKYNRRFARFYKDIQKPTLFVRYVTSTDVEYINESQKEIDEFLKSFNPQNEIIYIQNKDSTTLLSASNCYLVEKDKNDSVARAFLLKLPELEKYLLENAVPATTSVKKPPVLIKKLKTLIKMLRIRLGWYYHHNKAI